MDEKEILSYWDNLWKKDDYYAFWDIPIETDGVYSLLSKATYDSKPNQTILEIGSGPGTRSIPLAKEKNLQLTLLDKLLSAHNLAKKRSERYGMVSNYILGDARDLPLESESFDYVVSIGLNEHFFAEDRTKVFSEMERVTKKGGCTVVIVPNKWGAIELEQIIKERNKTWKYGPTELFNYNELKEFMGSLEFLNVELYGVSFFTSFTRLLPQKIQRRMFNNKFLWKSLTKIPGNFNVNSKLNKYFGEEIMAVGYK
jgi:ubiquinone/menaquinone biosynthesis C-methylase UbiE